MRFVAPVDGFWGVIRVGGGRRHVWQLDEENVVISWLGAQDGRCFEGDMTAFYMNYLCITLRRGMQMLERIDQMRLAYT